MIVVGFPSLSRVTCQDKQLIVYNPSCNYYDGKKTESFFMVEMGILIVNLCCNVRRSEQVKEVDSCE